jgi:hypothetical protein
MAPPRFKEGFAMNSRRLLSWRWTLLYFAIVAVVVIAVRSLEGDEAERLSERRLAEGLLCPYPRDPLTAFEIVFPTRSFRVERRGETWRLTAPVNDFADTTAIRRMLATLEVQEVDRWLPPPSGDQLAEFGLAEPKLVLHLETDRGVDTLRFGRLNEIEKRIWMQASWRDSLALVSTLLRSHWMKGRYKLSDQRPFASADLERLESFDIENARGSFTIRHGQRGWEIGRPEPYRANDRFIGALVEKLWRPGIIDFIDPSPHQLDAMNFDTPRVKVTAHLRGETRPRILEIGASFHKLSYARDLDRDSAFYLDSLTVSPLLESFSAYMSTTLLTLHPGKVTALGRAEGRRVEKVPESKWDWEDQEGRRVEGDSVARLLNRLMRISTERVDALLPRQDQSRLWGLDRPELALHIVFRGAEPALDLEFGPAIDGRIHFRRLDYPTVYSLPEERLQLRWPVPAPAQPTGG